VIESDNSTILSCCSSTLKEVLVVVITIDGVPWHQDFNRFDPGCPIIRDSDGAQAYLGTGPLIRLGDEGTLPDGLSAYEMVTGPNGGTVITICDQLSGYSGRVEALGIAGGTFAYVVKAT
jgi:hypothetical protein